MKNLFRLPNFEGHSKSIRGKLRFAKSCLTKMASSLYLPITAITKKNNQSRRGFYGGFIFLILFSIFTGCVSLVLRLSPELMDGFSSSIFEECDPELAKRAIPSHLKLMEGLLKHDSENRDILTSLAVGFAGYSLLFVEDIDPKRASRLYLRARDYGFKALGAKGDKLKESKSSKEDLENILKQFTERDIKALFWTTVSWTGWINLNLDKPLALLQLGVSQACLKRLLELNSEYFYGLPLMLMGASYAARPPMFGGNPDLSMEYFEKALAQTNRGMFLGQYYYARYYAVRVQDKTLFRRLLEEINSRNPEEMPEICLINTMIQVKSKLLLKKEEELFF